MSERSCRWRAYPADAGLVPDGRAGRSGAPNACPLARAPRGPEDPDLRLLASGTSVELPPRERRGTGAARASRPRRESPAGLECDGIEVRVLRPDGTVIERGRPLETVARFSAATGPRRPRAAAFTGGSSAPRLRRGAPVGRPAGSPARRPPAAVSAGSHGHRRRLRPPSPHHAHRRQRLPRRRRRPAAAEARAETDRPDPRAAAGAPARRAAGGSERAGAPVDLDAGGYCAAVERAKEYIRAGDVFQVVLSQRFTTPVAALDPLDVYRALRVVNPSPYMFFLDARRGVALVGASPEVLVRLRGRPGRGAADRRAPGRAARRDGGRRACRGAAAPIRRSAPSTSCSIDLGAQRRRPRRRATARVRVDRAHGGRALLPRDAPGLQRRGRARPGPVARSTSCAPASRPARVSGAPKSARWRSSRSSSRAPRASTRGAVGYFGYDGNLDLAIAIRTLLVTQAAPPTSRPAPDRRRLGAGARVRGDREQGAGAHGRDRAARRAQPVGRRLMLLVIDNYDSFTYNLVQYLGELGAELEVVPQRRDHGRGARRLAPERHRRSRRGRARRTRPASRSR